MQANTACGCVLFDLLPIPIRPTLFTWPVPLHVNFATTMYIHTLRVGQNHTYTVCIRYFWQGNHQMYGVNIRFWPALRTLHVTVWNFPAYNRLICGLSPYTHRRWLRRPRGGRPAPRCRHPTRVTGEQRNRGKHLVVQAVTHLL